MYHKKRFCVKIVAPRLPASPALFSNLKAMHKEPPITNLSFVSKVNKIKVLRLIRERKEMSRADIVKETGISPPTVSRLVDSLIHHERLVNHVGTVSTDRGRPPVMLEFAGSNNFVVGLDLGLTQITGVLSDLNARVLAEKKTLISTDQSFTHVMRQAAKVIDELIASTAVDRKHILGVGAAVSGLIDRTTNRLVYSAAFDWTNKDLAGDLSDRIDLPVIFDHSARVMALGELWYGIGNRYPHFICVLLGHGIGAAFIHGGKPYYGRNGMVGEFGHITLQPDSRIQCRCGNYGCLEALASGQAIAMAAQRGLRAHPRSMLKEMCQGDATWLTAELVAKAAREGDPFALEIFDKAAEYIGIGLATVINLHNPEAIVIGGGVAQAGEFFFDRIRKTVSERILDHLVEDIRIVPVTHGSKAKVMGSVALILDEILNLNISRYRNDVTSSPAVK